MKQAEAVRAALLRLQAQQDARPQEEKDREAEESAQSFREGTTLAPDGQVYVCRACGKTSPTKYGWDANEKRVATGGWDESCMLHAVLCHTEQVNGVWQAVPAAQVSGVAKEGK